jgi:hypothetical protein
MFTLEHKMFVTESYFKNIQACVEDFQNAFPNFPVEDAKFVHMLENVFENTKRTVDSCIEVGGEHLLQLLIKLHYSLVLHFLKSQIKTTKRKREP